MKSAGHVAPLFISVLLACGDGSSGPPQTTAVIVAPASLTIDEGATGTFTAVVTLSNGQPAINPVVAWASDNAAIASVAGAGTTATITGVSVGQTSVRATSGGVAGSGTVSVSQRPVARVTVSLSSATIVLSATAQATASVVDAQGRALTGRLVLWASTNPASATVSSIGLVTGISKGTAFVRATVEGRSDSVLVTVLGIANVAVSPDSLSLPPRGTATATATVAGDPGIATTVLWTSSNPVVATVSAAGRITALVPGAAVIRAASVADATKRDSVLLTVFDPCTRPTGYTLGSTVSGSITVTDCAGTIDELEAIVTTPTYYNVSVTASFPFSVYPYFAIPTGAFFSVPNQAVPVYAFVRPGSVRIRIVSNDTASGRTYTVSSTVDPPDIACSVVMSRGLSRAFALPASCQFNPGGTPPYTARLFNVPAPTTTSGALVLRANAVGYAVRLELRQPGGPVVATAVAPGVGQDAVLTYTNTQNTTAVMVLVVSSQVSSSTGPFTLTINP